MNKFTAAVITTSDKCAGGEREDVSGPALSEALRQHGWEIVCHIVLPDNVEEIESALVRCADEKGCDLIITTGGTGFSQRDITPEATRAVIDREAPGIAEAMRAESMRITPYGMLSRAVSGLRGSTLIVNVPGSKKAALECLNAVLPGLKHGVEMLREKGSTNHARVVAVCVSENKGEQKHEVESVYVKPGHGIEGDAHAGNWHRQVSLLGVESVAKVQKNTDVVLAHGAFAENLLTEGICLFALPVGAHLKIGEAVVEVTQIGKECHHSCAIRQAAGDCVMPREGIFVKVLKPGHIRAGESIELL